MKNVNDAGAGTKRSGPMDRRILVWLAGFEPQACAVIADLIAGADRAPRLRGGGR